MPSTLAQVRDRVEQMLADITNLVWSTPLIDEAIRQALDDYTNASPQGAETVITLPGAGREIALNNVAGLITVTEVWWPYDSLAQTWPPNRVQGFRLWWDDAQPVLFLNTKDASQPQINDELRLWYTKRHTLQDLDSAAVTTIPDHHESFVVAGAAGHAANIEGIDQIGQVHIDPQEVTYLRQWGNTKLGVYARWLAKLANQPGRGPGGEPWGPGWKLDKWDQ